MGTHHAIILPGSPVDPTVVVVTIAAMRAPPDALLLDFDGTVIVFDRRAAFAHARPDADAPTLDALARMDREHALAGRYDRAALLGDTACEHRFWDGIVAHTRPMPGAIRLLDHCRDASIPVALVTDTDGDGRDKRARVAASGLADRFDAIVIAGETVPERKPDTAPFAHALDRLGARATHSVMVGDKVDADARPAAALGMRAIWLRGEYPGEWTPAVDSLDEVIAHL